MNCLITGGTSGVGLSIVKSALEKGFNVIAVGSNDHSCHQMQAELTKAYGEEKIKYFATDIATLEGVVNLSSWLDENYAYLDLIVHCAGIVTFKNETTSDGYDRIFATNYLSVLRTTLLCLPLLKKSQQARVLVTSGIPFSLRKAKINFDDLEFEKRFRATDAIMQSILCRAVFTMKLAQELAYCKIAVNTFHPGFVRSKLTRHFPKPIRTLTQAFQGLLAKTSATGNYLLDASESYQTGQWFMDCMPVPHHLEQISDENMERLWALNDQFFSPKPA
jgi:NAD(P)-dependent dehydrogenase (short-subunit alcohol dehydrogenase family)